MMGSPFSAETILAQPSLFAPPGTSRRGPYIGWSIVVLVVVIIILLATGTIKFGSSPVPQPSPVGIENLVGLPAA
jgi:hypothetical protein